MCGRFNILTDVDALMTTFEILKENNQLKPFFHRYNISPTAKNTSLENLDDERVVRIPIIRLGSDHRRWLKSAVWPLIPRWVGAMVPKYSTANARGEFMHSTASFRQAWRQAQRCLIPVTGFYEWQLKTNQRLKQPWHIYHRAQSIMALAGLWESGRTTQGDEFESCTIVTTQANRLMARIHNTNFRMPVIIDPPDWQTWLGCGNESALQLSVPYREGQLAAAPISTHINNPKYNEPNCINPMEVID